MGHGNSSSSLICIKGGGTYFYLGGGGQRQKKGTNGVHADNYFYDALMEHHCSHKVSFYMLRKISVVFLLGGGLNKTYPPHTHTHTHIHTHTHTHKEKSKAALQAQGF